MVSQQQARSLALGLPETIEQDHHGRPSFRVAGKIFATLWDEDHMNVMLDEAGILTAAQREPETCTEFWWGKRLGAIHVHLYRVDPDRLADLLADAWERKAPPSLAAGAAAPRQEQERRT
ncbi:MAG: MmcQ/YjbR family DNA-binding protein [Actinobacteria bacterium]|nr:MAG: MmcQ/YjbR family DNA-binding protein [Actinomycetota bacterium]